MAIEYDSKNKNATIANLGDTKPAIVIGGRTGKFVPNANFSFECESGSEKYYLNVNRKSVSVANEKESFASEKLRISVGNETDIWHIDEKGRLNWDIEFKEKPPTNVFEWELKHSEGLEFFYQPALTQAEIDNHAFRPDDVVGSYAVYCDKSGHHKDASGETIVNYTTGKLLHIYRPLCKDADGKEAWAELNIEKGILRVTIPQKYLDESSYPVTLDPNFGNEDIGGTSAGYLNNIRFCSYAETTPASGGTLSSIKLYSKYNDAGATMNPAIYSNGSGVPGTKLAAVDSGGTAIGSSAGWVETSITASVTASTQYWLGYHGGSSGSYAIWYDSSGANYWRSRDGSAWADTWEETDHFQQNVSIYAVYTAGGASNAPSWGMRLGMNRGAFRGMK